MDSFEIACSAGDSEKLKQLFLSKAPWPDSWDSCWLSAVSSNSFDCVVVLDNNGVEEPTDGWNACFSIFIFDSKPNLKIAEYILNEIGASLDFDFLIGKAIEFKSSNGLLTLLTKYSNNKQ